MPRALLIGSLLLALAPTSVGAQAVAQQAAAPAPARRSGPPAPLAGVPLALECDGGLPDDHPVLRRYPGQDANDLAVEAEVADSRTWANHFLCDTLWEVLSGAGAHPTPSDVRLPARAVLRATLRRLWVEGSRVVEQRVGSTIMPVSIPHWAVAMAWDFEFHVEYLQAADAGPAAPPPRSTPLRLSLGGTAEQDDYAPLRMGSLLRAAAIEAFDELPRVIADDGQLGDLLFALVPRPEGAPSELALSGALEEGFWQLLSTDARQRHDAMAFYLSTALIRGHRQVEMARWFTLNDPDPALRRDALGWLIRREGPDPEAPLSETAMELLGWLILRDRSARMRGEAVELLSKRGGPGARALLVAASADADPRVADRAISGLRDEPPPTAAELQTAPAAPVAPAVAAWSSALDGRVPSGSDQLRDEALLGLALGSGGSASETWLVRWLVKGPGEGPWLAAAWEELATEGSFRVRREALGRLGRESSRPEVAEALTRRIGAETDDDLLREAITGLRRFDVRGLGPALLKASRASSVPVRSAAVAALAGVPGKDVDERLERLAADDPDGKVRRTARKVLRARAKVAWEAGEG